jgi:sulfatase modifying factor 1
VKVYAPSERESLERILLSIELGAEFHEFALYFVQCSLPAQQDEYIDYLKQRCEASGISLVRLDLSDRVVEDLRQCALDFVNQKPAEQISDNMAIAVTGLEASILLDSNEEYPAVLQIMNLGREKYSTDLPYPFIIFLSDRMLRKVQNVAPDFWSWRSAEPERFDTTPDSLNEEEKALSLNRVEGWHDAVSQVSHIERLLEAYSESHNTPGNELGLLSRLGDAYRFLEKYQKAYNPYVKALKIAEELGNSEERASILNKLGIVMRGMGDLDVALGFFRDYLGTAEGREDLTGQGMALNNMGLIYLDKGEFSGAVKTLEDALAINEKSSNPQALSDTLGNLGLAYYRQGNFDTAIEYYNRSLEISQKLDNQGGHWKDLLYLGLAYSEKGEFETAFRYYSDAASVSQSIGDLIGEKRCLIQLARCASQMEEYDAVAFYEQALEVARSIKDNVDEYNILTELAGTYRDADEQEKAVSHYEEALKKAQEFGDPDRELSCFISLIQLHGRGEPDNVARYKESAKLRLRGSGDLKTETLNAWLVDDRDQIPGALSKDKRYTLYLNIGDIPARYEASKESSKAVKSSFPVAQTEFIYNLAGKTDFRSYEHHEGKESAEPTAVFRPVASRRRPSGQRQSPIERSDVRRGLVPATAGVEGISQRSGVNESRLPSEPGPIEEVHAKGSSALIEVQVNIEGIGFDCDKRHDILEAPWRHEARLPFFPVIPKELGEARLDVKCEANGIPFDIMLSANVEESPDRPEDGAPMALIPAGEFEMGTDPEEIPELVQWAKKYYSGVEANWFENETPRHKVYLDDFYMDVYEVTNAQYARFLNEYGGNTDAAGHQLLDIDSDYCLIEGTGNTYRPKAGYENHPVIEVSWYGAAAYAQFYGKRLPTEAEWEKAARGGLVGKRYPWGDELDPGKANCNADLVGSRSFAVEDMLKYLKPVGSFPPNGYGLHDMAGNVWEWCADWYSGTYYADSPRENPQGPGSGTRRVLRGGSWGSLADYLRAASRGDSVPSSTGSLVGFRCVAQD